MIAKDPLWLSWNRAEANARITRREQLRLFAPPEPKRVLPLWEPWLTDRGTAIERPLRGTCNRCQGALGVSTPMLGVENDTRDPELPWLLVVLSSPTTDEDINARPASGAAARLAKKAIEACWTGNVRYTYALQCPDSNNADIARCLPHLWHEIDSLQPDRIFFLGARAIQLATKHWVDTEWRVARGHYRGVQFFGLPDPLRSLSGNHRLRYFGRALRRSCTDRVEPITGETRVLLTGDELTAWLKRNHRRRLTIDVEHGGSLWGKGFRLLAVNMAVDGNSAVVATPQALQEAEDEFCAMLVDPLWEKANQTIKYDRHALYRAFGVDIQGVVYDTMLGSQVLLSEAKHGLGPQSWLIGYGGFKAAAKSEEDGDRSSGNKYESLAPDVLHAYGGRDAAATYKLMERQLESFPAAMWQTYRNLIRPAFDALAIVERNGLLCDVERVRQFDADLQQQLAGVRKALDQQKSVQQLQTMLGAPLNPASNIQKQKLLYDILKFRAPKDRNVQANTLKRLAAETPHPVLDGLLTIAKLGKQIGTYGLGMLDKVSPLDGRIHTNFGLVRTGRLSCLTGDAPVLTRRRGWVRMDEVRVGDEVWTHRGRWRRACAAWKVGLRRAYRVVFSDGTELRATDTHRFCTERDTWVSVERMLDGGFETLAFKTERPPVCRVTRIDDCGLLEVYDISVEEDESYLSGGVFSHNSKEPNCQNLTKPKSPGDFGSRGRGMFVAPPGHKFVAIDYSQQELRVAAMLSGDEVMAAAFESGIDFHTMTAAAALKKNPKDVTETERGKIGKCFHPDTEALTPRGWVRIGELTAEDRVAQAVCGPRHAVELQWVKPLALYRRSSPGELIHFECEGMNLRVTPDHRMLGYTIGGNPREYRADGFKGPAASWVNAGKLTGTREVDPRLLRLAVAAQADGSIENRRLRFGFTKERKVERLLQLLGFEASRARRNKITRIDLTREESAPILALLDEDKTLPWWWLELTQELRETVLEESRHWDGHWREGWRSTQYYSTPRKNLDVMQAIASITNRKSAQRGNVLTVRAAGHNHTAGRSNLKETRIPYEGDVVCLSVPSSCVLVRDRGIPVITKQCLNFAIIFGKSERGIAEDIGTTEDHAKQLMASLLSKYAKLGAYLRRAVAEAQATGYVKARWEPMGWYLARPVPDIIYRPNETRGEAEGLRKHYRNIAKNTPIQNVANNFSLASLIEAVAWCQDEQPRVKLVMTVHDELLFEVPEDLIDTTVEAITGIMLSWPSGVCRLKVDVEIGDDWGHMEPYEKTPTPGTP